MTDWQDRIIGTEEGDPSELVKMLHPDNPKSHPEEQMEGIEHSLNKVGWIDRPIWNKRTNYFLDGNGRVKLALMAGQSSIKYDVVDLTPEEEQYVLATFDALGGMAEIDAVKLLALVNAVGEDLPVGVSEHLLGMVGESEEDYANEEYSSLPLPPSAQPGNKEPPSGESGHSGKAGSGNFFDASRLPDISQGKDKTSYLIYVTFPDFESFRQGIETLSGGKRTVNSAIQRMATMEGEEILQKIREGGNE